MWGARTREGRRKVCSRVAEIFAVNNKSVGAREWKEMLTEGDEELVVVRVVQALHQVGEGGEFGKDLNDFRSGNELIGQNIGLRAEPGNRDEVIPSS